MEEVDVRGGLEQALKRLRDADQHLLENNSNERSIASKLAGYLDKYFSKYEYNVDFDYNRQGDAGAAKRLKLPEEWRGPTDRVMPDVIVHHRGCNSQNLLVIEMKKSPNQESRERDGQRIKAFCEQLDYNYGALVECETKTKPPTISIAKWYSCQK